jgi:hypothetical protein
VPFGRRNACSISTAGENVPRSVTSNESPLERFTRKRTSLATTFARFTNVIQTSEPAFEMAGKHERMEMGTAPSRTGTRRVRLGGWFGSGVVNASKAAAAKNRFTRFSARGVPGFSSPLRLPGCPAVDKPPDGRSFRPNRARKRGHTIRRCAAPTTRPESRSDPRRTRSYARRRAISWAPATP